MELLKLFITASLPVLKLLLITAIGLYLALDRVNILRDQASRNNLNAVVFYVFSPALVGTYLARTITYGSMLKLWFMPVNILITFIIGSVLGWILIQLTRPPAHLRGLVLGCCAGGNLGIFPLIIVPAVCKEKGSPFGAPDVCHTYALAYASLSMAIGTIYLWSYVYNIVRISAKRVPQLPTQQSSQTQMISSTITTTTTSNQMTTSASDKLKQRIMFVFQKLRLRTIFSPSSIGAIVGFVIGVIPQIRKLFIGDGAPLWVIQDTASLLGDGAIPSLILILGGNLLKGLRGSEIQKSVIVGIMIVRYVALPVVGFLVVKGALRFGFVHSDPLYLFLLLLQFALPPSMAIVSMTQMFAAGEKECSVIMLWTYVFASVSLTFWSAVFMWFLARYI